ncbi:MAG: hypothetical protein CMO74_12590 [Verrucomicrobiales bacterium]|nr:hypothetical protein [Verrucomicrobiales bacterium]|tara:strand:- start:17107 stop:18861 length:1755 start_codon:yes stop_codon:yes gene_type:complete
MKLVSIKYVCFALIFWAVMAPPSKAAPAPQDLLPRDTVAMFTVPDAKVFGGELARSLPARFWGDPHMAEFARSVERGMLEMFFNPGEGRNPLGLFSFAEGQVTLGLALPAAGAKEAFAVLLLDGGKKADALAGELDALVGQARADGMSVGERMIRDVKFHHLRPKNLPAVHVGMSGTLLIAGNDPDRLEKILVRQAGGKSPALNSHPSFAKRFKAQFAMAPAFGWLDTLALFKELPVAGVVDEGVNPGNMMKASGLNELRSISFSISGNLLEGELFLEVPESSRRGLFAIMTPDQANVAPPPFAPENLALFMRARIDMARAWKAFEGVLVELSPDAGKAVDFIERAAQAADPQFNLRDGFIKSMGNDIILLEWPSRANGLDNPDAWPAIVMVESKKPAVTLKGIRNLATIVSPKGPERRGFLGRSIYTYKLGDGLVEQEAPDAPSIHLTTVANYIAAAKNRDLLETFLRGPDNLDLRPLRDLPALKAAVQKVGGFESGFLYYSDDRDSFRELFHVLRSTPNPAELLGQYLPLRADGRPHDLHWIDFKKLPEFDRVSGYFPVVVIGMISGKDGFSIKGYSSVNAE